MNVYHLGWIKLFNQKIAGIRLHQPDESRLVICLRGKDGIRWQIWPIFFFKVHFRSDGGSLFETQWFETGKFWHPKPNKFHSFSDVRQFLPPEKGEWWDPGNKPRCLKSLSDFWTPNLKHWKKSPQVKSPSSQHVRFANTTNQLVF